MSSISFLKGMTTGLVVGTAVTIMFDPITDRQRHRMQRKTNGMFKSIGGVIDTAMDVKHRMF